MRVNSSEIVDYNLECLEVSEDITRRLRDEFLASLPEEVQHEYDDYFEKERMAKASEEGLLGMKGPTIDTRFVDGYGFRIHYREEERIVVNMSQRAGRCITALLFSDERLGKKQWPTLSESEEYAGHSAVQFQQEVCGQYAQEMIEVKKLGITKELVQQLGKVQLKHQN